MLRLLGCYRKALFCWCVLAACGGSLLAGDRVQPEYLPQPPQREKQIAETLAQSSECTMHETAFHEVVDFLSDFHQINILIDTQALAEDGIDPDFPVTIKLSGVSLRSTLRLLLPANSLTYVVEDEVLKITTTSRAAQIVKSRTYPVADLATTPEEFEELLAAVRLVLHDPGMDDAEMFYRSAAAVPLAKSLLVRQTYAKHEQVLELLRNLREAKTLADKADNAGEPVAAPATEPEQPASQN